MQGSGFRAPFGMGSGAFGFHCSWLRSLVWVGLEVDSCGLQVRLTVLGIPICLLGPQQGTAAWTAQRQLGRDLPIYTGASRCRHVGNGQQALASVSASANSFRFALACQFKRVACGFAYYCGDMQCRSGTKACTAC